MSVIQMRKFTSLWDGIVRFTGIFKGPFLITAFLGTEKKFREKLLITVTLANNCYT